MTDAAEKTSNQLPVPVDNTLGKGELVYNSYEPTIHVHPQLDSMKTTTRTNTLIVAIETGLNPAVVVMDLQNDGVLRVYDAVGEANTPANLFCNGTVLPLLYRRHGYLLEMGACELVISPPNKKKAQCSARAAFQIYSAIDMFKDKVSFAPTSVIQARLAASERFLSSVHPQIVSGRRSLRHEKPTPKPGLQICPYNAQLLIESISEKYRYKTTDNGSSKKPVIETVHPYSDVVTAFQYGCLVADDGDTFGCAVGDVAHSMPKSKSDDSDRNLEHMAA